MKLFMFFVGDDCGSTNVEPHDVKFSIGQTPRIALKIRYDGQ
jgi:hypothetical protein